MARGKLFEYAVLYHPKNKRDAAGNELENNKTQLVSGPTTIVAVSDKEVAMIAARSLPETYMDKLEDVEVVVRPF